MGDGAHDAVMADRAQMTAAIKDSLTAIAQRHLAFKGLLTLKNHAKMRENLKLLHVLSEHVEVDSGLFAWLVKECQRVPQRSMSESFAEGCMEMGKERRKTAILKAEESIKRCRTLDQVAVQQRKLSILELSAPTPASDPALQYLIEVIERDSTITKDVAVRALAIDDRYKVHYSTLCAKYNKRMPTADQRNAQRLMQYSEVKHEFQDEDRDATPVMTATMWKWFRGERRKYTDGRAFWDAYALLCGYVDDEGAPLKPDGEKFHCDHIMTRKRERTSTEDGQGIGSFAVDHWTNYAIVWACLNMDTQMWEGQADEVSGLKRWLHGNDAMDALDKGIAVRSQAVDSNRKHMASILNKIGRPSDSKKHLKAWQPGPKHEHLVGGICVLARRRSLKDMLKAQATSSDVSTTLAEPVQEVADMDTSSSSSDAPATPPGSPPSALQSREDETEGPPIESAQAAGKRPVEVEPAAATAKKQKKLAHEFSTWFLEKYEQDNEKDAKGSVVHFQPLKDIVEVYKKHDTYLQMKFTDQHEVGPMRFKKEFQTHSVLADAFKGAGKVKLAPDGKLNTKEGIVHYKRKHFQPPPPMSAPSAAATTQ